MKRMLLLPLTVAVAAFCSAFAHKEDAEVIENRQLTWGDYKAAPAAQGLTVALTHSRIELDSVEFPDDGSVPAFKATCYFMPERSWVDRNFLSSSTPEERDHVLRHEQTHYDIACIATAEMNKVMNSFPYDRKRIPEQADSIFRSLSMKLRKVQTEYDEQTMHSRIYEEQDRWNKKVAECMVTKRLPEP